MRLKFSVIKLVSFLVLGSVLFFVPQASAKSLGFKRILIIFPYENNMPGFISFDASFRSTLTAWMDYQFEFYAECMDLTRFPDERYSNHLMELYREKYSSVKLDLIIAVLRPSIEFLSKYNPEFFHDIPVILYDQDAHLLSDLRERPSLAAVVSGSLDIEGTLALAMRLHPDVRNVYVVTGASAYDRLLEGLAKDELYGFENKVELSYLAGLRLDELLLRVQRLPENSLILYVSMFMDGGGKVFKSPEALAFISKQAKAPIYSISETYIGSGIVGGQMISHYAQGSRLARVALSILAGGKYDQREFDKKEENRYIFDARELKRWGISEKGLPPGSDLRFKEFSVWETHRWRIIGIVLILILQALLILVLVHNARRRRRSEAALQKISQEWQMTFDSTTDMIVLLDNRLRIVRANAAAASFAELSLDSIRAKPCHSVICATGEQLCDCSMAKMSLETKEHQEAVLHNERKDVWLLVTIDPILDYKNEIIGVVYTSKNITQQKRAEETIRASEEFKQAILASFKNGIAILDKNGTILAVNKAWEQCARQNDSSSLAAVGPGVNYLEVCRQSTRAPSDFAGQTLAGIRSILDGRSDGFSLEYPHDSPSESRWFLMRVMPFNNADGGVVISHVDITARKAAEFEARRRMEELAHVTRLTTIGEMTASLTHEISQPLSAILNNAEAAQGFLDIDKPDIGEVRQILDDIIRDDRRAVAVMRKVRALVRKDKLGHEPLDLRRAIQEIDELLRGELLRQGISTTIESSQDSVRIRGDRVQLQQVILNLLLNSAAAMKNSPPDRKRIILRISTLDNGGVKVSVTDFGSGIDQNALRRIFEPFYTTKRDGLGMGLSISQTIIKDHGGTIEASNNPEGGATLSFMLPAP